MTYNSRLAQTGQVADTHRGEALHDTCFAPTSWRRATFAARGTPGDRGAVGLSTAGAARCREADLQAAVDADWELSRRYGVTGVPTFVVGRQGVVGAQPLRGAGALVGKAGTQTNTEG